MWSGLKPLATRRCHSDLTPLHFPPFHIGIHGSRKAVVRLPGWFCGRGFDVRRDAVWYRRRGRSKERVNEP